MPAASNHETVGMAEPLRWLSTEQVAHALGVKQRDVYRLIDDGLLPGYRIGRAIKVKRADLDAYADASGITLNPVEPSAWLRVDQVAQAVGVKQRDVYRLIDDGLLPGYRIGQAVQIKRADLEVYANATSIELNPIADPPFRRRATLLLVGVPEDWADTDEVAEILGLSHRDSVTSYLHRYPDMPRPVSGGGRGTRLFWDRAAIVRWRVAHPPRKRAEQEA